MAANFPTEAAQITPEWMTKVLLDAGALSDGRVAHVEIQSVAEQGQGSLVLRLSLTNEGPEHETPRSLIAKLPAPHQPVREHLHNMGMDVAEVRFYQDIAEMAEIPIPFCYFSKIDTKTGDFLILLEDMSACRAFDREHALDDVQCAMDALSGMHARWWCSPKLSEFKWLRQHDDVPHYQLIKGVLNSVLPVTEQKFPKHFTGYLRDVARKVAKDWDRFIIKHIMNEPFTLIHADYHPGQMFFAGDSRGRFAVFDWSSVAARAPGIDLANIMVTGLHPAEMREHRARLIARYHEGLLKGGVKYDEEQLDIAARIGLVGHVFTVVFASAATDMNILEEKFAKHGEDYKQRWFSDLSEVLEDNRVMELLD